MIEMKNGTANRIPAYLPGGGSVQILSVDPDKGRVGLELPGMELRKVSSVLAVEVSTKPLINLVWLGAIIMLLSGFLTMARRFMDLRQSGAASPGRS